MNKWDEKKKVAIVEADDFMDRWDRNGLNFLFAWKAKYSKFKITLYTVPNRTSENMLNILEPFIGDWIELAIHGWDHESNFECYGWDYERTKMFMERTTNKILPHKKTKAFLINNNIVSEENLIVEPGGFIPDNKIINHTLDIPMPAYTRNFKAPGWTITPGGPEDLGGNGYPAGENDPIKKDPTAAYRALTDMDFIICDRHYNKAVRPTNSKVICIDCNDGIVHFHTWNVPSGDPNGRNGFQDIEERFGVPWDETTEFFFMSEAWEKGLYKPCI